MTLELSWTMKRDGDALAIHYDVKNTGTSPVWLVDQLLVWGGKAFEKAPEAVVVRRGDAPDTVSFFRGNLYIPSREMRKYRTPGVREVPAGGTLSGDARTPLPLAAWHNYHPDKMPPLQGSPAQAVLEIQVLTDKGDPQNDWETITLQDGSTLEVPYLRFLNEKATVLSSAPQPIPKN